MYTLDYSAMAEYPEHVRSQLRKLSFGPDEGTLYRWTFHEGRCYAARLMLSGKTVAWACITFCEDKFPVVGVYVHEDSRGLGLSRVVTSYLLERADLPKGTAVYAVSRLWPAWPDIIENAGLSFFDWED